MAVVRATVNALDPSNSSKNTFKLENTEKRDTLIAIEKKYQAQWAKSGVFEQDAPSTSEIPLHSISPKDLRSRYPKFFGTMAYPYMNGTLHAGHSFTVSKIEFTIGYARMQGKRALFPLGFHCTGMPIKACADKLVDEVRKFGKDFKLPAGEEEDILHGETGRKTPAPTQAQTKEDVTKFSSKKGKAAAKSIKMKYQFQIMLALGIPIQEIHKFADPQHWLQFFPPLCKRDLTNFGARIDWRRSMVTTDANPYYDAFVRWQMNRLKEIEKIRLGKRYTVYSPKDGQPCMDHDRSEGEGIGSQSYTALKLRVKEWAPEAAKLVEGKIPEGANVFFVPATLRPETMYGQTCCFVGPKITYGVYKAKENEYYVITERAARNMAFQGIYSETVEKAMRDHASKNNQLPTVVELPGSSVVGTLVNAPLSVHTGGVRILPMESVLPTKGTGVVTSVPSDSPDDYATVTDLAKKAEYYGIQRQWAELEIVPIIETPSYGNLTAPFLVKQMKINSPKDAKQLAEAKDLAYKEGFYKGTMLVGKYKGSRVEDVKEEVGKYLIKQGDAFNYAEPTGLVMSRSGDPCVVAYMDQWFLNYGEEDPEWRREVLDYVLNDNGLNTYASETKNQFEGTLNWLNSWACARTYGLGTKLPFDKNFLVESLSDSTIYMAYYTIAHYLHKDIFGKEPGKANVQPGQMTDEVWDYLFTRRDLDDEVTAGGISKTTLESMRREFEYWYPLDMRVSGKDLINNHLTFFLYIHIALFPKELWPQSIRCNGHLLLNGEKMSKHTGNFLTLEDTVNKYGADATRIALADAGDGIEDANFEESVANSSILRLFTQKEWCEDIMKDPNLRTGPIVGFWDKLFENELSGLVHEARQHYENTMYKLALKSSLYDFLSARDFYREATSAAGIGMHRDLVARYLVLQALVLTPIAPHWAEYLWLEVLKKSSTIQNELFPILPEASAGLSAAREYVRSTTSNITSAEAAQQKKKDKGKNIAFDPKLPKKLTIFAAAKYPAWQEKYIDLVREAFDETSLSVNDKELNPKVSKMGEMKKAMPFVQGLKKRLVGGEKPQTVFDRKLAFDELETLREMSSGLTRATGCKSVEIMAVDEGGKTGCVVLADGGEGNWREGLPPNAEQAVPGSPTFHFENVDT
ncbi:MAG: cytosolic leucyl tRNA synthetase [Pycnora praestabilis]|nr:MAG: cytosolic leucyl tRNA synthetase [Pycnora praestabilis]